MRGFGGPEGAYPAEVIIEHLAHELKQVPFYDIAVIFYGTF